MYTDEWTKLPYCEVYKEHLENKGLCLTDKMILALLCFKVYKKNTLIVFKPKDLCDLSGYTPRTVRRSLQRLKDLGILTEEDARNPHLRVFHLCRPVSDRFVKCSFGFHVHPVVPVLDKIAILMLQCHWLSHDRYIWLTNGTQHQGLVYQCHISRCKKDDNPFQALNECKLRFKKRKVLQTLRPARADNKETAEIVTIDFEALQRAAGYSTGMLPEQIEEQIPDIQAALAALSWDQATQARHNPQVLPNPQVDPVRPKFTPPPFVAPVMPDGLLEKLRQQVHSAAQAEIYVRPVLSSTEHSTTEEVREYKHLLPEVIAEIKKEKKEKLKESDEAKVEDKFGAAKIAKIWTKKEKNND